MSTYQPQICTCKYFIQFPGHCQFLLSNHSLSHSVVQDSHSVKNTSIIFLFIFVGPTVYAF